MEPQGVMIFQIVQNMGNGLGDRLGSFIYVDLAMRNGE